MIPAWVPGLRLAACLLLGCAAAVAGRVVPGAVEAGDASKQPWIEQLSWHPRAYLYHHFLSDEECDHIIKISSPHIERSTVVNMDGSISDDPIRTSWGTFLARGQDETVWAVEHRVANWTHLPAENAEDMQVLRYRNNQTYGAHWDDLDLDENPEGLGGGSVRVATVLIYLSDVEYGGETAFPHSRFLDKAKQTAGQRWSDCARDVVATVPRKGNAIMFFDTKPGSMRQDKWSMHAGCPVLAGEKWTAVKWIHARQFGSPYPSRPLSSDAASLQRAEQLLAQKRQQADSQQPQPACVDRNEGCSRWAREGECAANPEYMREECRFSCGVCCPEGDVLCERRRKRVVPVHR